MRRCHDCNNFLQKMTHYNFLMSCFTKIFWSFWFVLIQFCQKQSHSKNSWKCTKHKWGSFSVERFVKDAYNCKVAKLRLFNEFSVNENSDFLRLKYLFFTLCERRSICSWLFQIITYYLDLGTLKGAILQHSCLK